MVYLDARYEWLKDFRATLEEWLLPPPHVALTSNKPGRPSFAEAAFSKHDSFVLMDVDAVVRIL